MDTLLNSNPLETLQDAKEWSLQKLKELASQKLFSQPTLRLEMKIGGGQNILPWLAALKQETLFFWSDRDNRVQIGGVGEADRIVIEELDFSKLFSRANQNLSMRHPRLRYYGGFCFDPLNTDSTWQSFPATRFWIPRFELLQTAQGTFFVCNIIFNDEPHVQIERAIRELEDLRFEESCAQNFPPVAHREDQPDQATWMKTVEDTIQSLKNSDLKKIVLARKSTLDLSGPLNPFQFMEKIIQATSNCFHFCFQPAANSVFLGATPERLYLREKDQIKTEAIAGTRRRGQTAKEDEQLKEELLHSPKDALEHNFVVASIEEEMQKLCSKVQVLGEKAILQLNEGIHLISRFEGILKPSAVDPEILKALHPTPAVAGTPTEKAIRKIAELEPFRRGWYAGCVGSIGWDTTEMAVGIRSCFLRGKQLSLYSGAGIVQESVPQEEWNEIENKMSSFLRILKPVQP